MVQRCQSTQKYQDLAYSQEPIQIHGRHWKEKKSFTLRKLNR
jgi:hypothetical protein